MVCNYVLLLELEELFVVNKLSHKFCFFSFAVVNSLAKIFPGVVVAVDLTFAPMIVKGILYIRCNQSLCSFGAGLRLLFTL